MRKVIVIKFICRTANVPSYFVLFYEIFSCVARNLTFYSIMFLALLCNSNCSVLMHNAILDPSIGLDH